MSTTPVVFGLADIVVTITINFNNEPVIEADKIDNKKLDGVLSPKFSTQPGGPQLLPQGVLGGRRGFAVFAGVDFGFVPGAHIGGVDVLVRRAKGGGIAHGGKIKTPGEGTSPPDPLSKKEGEPDVFFE